MHPNTAETSHGFSMEESIKDPDGSSSSDDDENVTRTDQVITGRNIKRSSKTSDVDNDRESKIAKKKASNEDIRAATCSDGLLGEESTDRNRSSSSDDETVARTDQEITGGNKKRAAGSSDDNDRESKITKKASNNDEDGGSASCSGQQQQESTSSSAINRTIEVADYGIDIAGVSSIPFPVCSCTGTFRRCYKNGRGRWQSACCTSRLSDYPLPLNPQSGVRIGGREMRSEAFKRVLEKLKAERYDFSKPIDLKHQWAKRGRRPSSK